MAKPIWSDEEKEKLIRLCNQNKTLKKLKSEFPDKTEAQIRKKCTMMNLNFNKKRKTWTEEETQNFIRDWNDYNISIERLRKKYKNRSIIALRTHAQRLKLSNRTYDDSYLTIADITSEMQVSKNRVRTWLKNGLKYHKSHIKPVKYLIDPDDLLDFLKEHPRYYDASKISKYLFNPEPAWLKEKRTQDINDFRTRSKKSEYYSDPECTKIINMFKQGKSNIEIAKELNRTEYGIERMLSILGFSRRKYNQYEIDIIKKYHTTKTIDEITAMLPLRTRAGVIAKCEDLKIKYITKKKNKHIN